MRSISQFFQYMHDVDFPYVVLRNFDNLPNSVAVGEHDDLDLLVQDIKHFREIFPDILPTHDFPRMRHRARIDKFRFYIDVRYLGDGYYPLNFQRQMLDTREYNSKGFFTPNPLMFRLGLAYHAVHHKGENTYQRWLGNVTIKELAENLKKSTIGYSVPLDNTVGKFNQYWKGATSTVSREGGIMMKDQTSYNNFDLSKNEERILIKCVSKYFPKVYGRKKGLLMIEDCGDRLNGENLPEDWKLQMANIAYELKKYNIQHRDIKIDNFMVKNGVIKLIDFGWSRFYDDPQDSPPQCLGYPYKPSYGFDDNFSLRKVIKELDYQQQEREVFAHV